MWATVQLVRQQWPDYPVSGSRSEGQPLKCFTADGEESSHIAQPAGAEKGLEREQQVGGAVARQLLQGGGHRGTLSASLLIHPGVKAGLQGHMTPFWPLARLFLLLELPLCVLFSPPLKHPLETRAGTPICWALLTHQTSFTRMSQTFRLSSRTPGGQVLFVGV